MNIIGDSQEEICRILFTDLEMNLIPAIGKNPVVPWKVWQTARVPLEQLIEWSRGRFISSDGRAWQIQPGTPINWAMPTGRRPYSSMPALVVIDTDDEQAEKVVRTKCPPTPAMQITGRGGTHRLYRRPNVESVPNRGGTATGGVSYKIDIRGDGGYIMAPGSIHPKTGKRYRWVQPWTVEMLAALPIYDPVWLGHEGGTKLGKTRPEPGDFDHETAVAQDCLVPLPLRIAAATRYLGKCPGTTAGAAASNTCFRLAVVVCWGFGIPADEAIELLFEWGQGETNRDESGRHYPWTWKEIAHKVMNACAAPYDGIAGDKMEGQTRRLEDEFCERFAQLN